MLSNNFSNGIVVGMVIGFNVVFFFCVVDVVVGWNDCVIVKLYD